MTSGGRRPGAGRPALAQGEKRTEITLNISPRTRRLINRLKAEGVVISREFDAMVYRLAVECGVAEDNEPNI